MFHHILVPLDGSSRAEQALPVAAQIAHFTNGSLLLVQVISPPPPAYAGAWSPVPLIDQETIDTEIASATSYLKTLATSPGLSGIQIRTDVLFGLPIQRLTELIEARGIDLVVLCSHGRTGFIRWVLGSVAHGLAHQSTAPILVLRQREAASVPPLCVSAGPLRTLVSLDGSALAEAALRPAAQLTAALAAAGQGMLLLAQVVKVSPVREEERLGGPRNDRALQHARTYLSQVEACLLPVANDLQISLAHSVETAADVASALLTLAEHGNNGAVDLIAISTHGRGGVGRWVMGSVTQRLLNTTTLPILIVRPSQRDEGIRRRS